MGCWDVTCAVTNLPIQDGDPIRFFFLRQPLYADGVGKSFAQWLPVTVPIKGIYNNYGAVTGYDDRIIQFQRDCLKRFAVWDSDRDDGHDDHPDDPDFPNTMKSLISACERGGLRLRLPYNDHCEGEDPVFKTVYTAPFMVHEEIYQHMIAGPDRAPPGVGTWRRRLEKSGDRRIGRGKVESLRGAVEWAQGADDRKRLREILVEKGEKDLASSLDEMHSIFLRDTGSNLENMPDLTCIGNEWEPKIESFPTLFEFTEEDWTELGNRALDQEVFFWTMKECRRLMYPALYMDQYYYPDNDLTSSLLLNHFISTMTVAFEKKERERHEEEDE